MFYVIALFLIAGLIMVVMGFMEAQAEAPEAATVRLTRLSQRRIELSPEEKARREAEKEFAKREEQRATSPRRTTFLPTLSGMVSSHALLSRLEADLLQIHSQWRASELLAASVLLMLVGFITLLYTGFMWWLALPLSLLFLAFPWSYVRAQRKLYYRKFDEQLADTLMLMANSLKAGFSFLQSMEMVSRESRPPIASEFSLVTQEITVGIPIQQALQNLSDRVVSMDLQLMVTAVIIQREVGGGLAEILDTISGVIRERMTIKREIRTLTTQGRLTGAILAGLPLFLGLAIHLMGKMSAPSEPSFVQPLFATDFGRYLLIGAVISQIIGFMIIMKIVSIKV